MEDIRFPYAWDKNKKQSSSTLFFTYVSFIISIVTIIIVSFSDVLMGSILALTLFFGSLLFYRLRRLDTFSIDLDDKIITVNESKPKKEKSSNENP